MERVKPTSEESITDKDLQRIQHGLMFAAVLSQLHGLRGKYTKQTLTRCESSGILSTETRKHILDGFGDYAREVQALLLGIAQD
jgi:hypothetical protein